jgi:hypothetical protein
MREGLDAPGGGRARVLSAVAISHAFVMWRVAIRNCPPSLRVSQQNLMTQIILKAVEFICPFRPAKHIPSPGPSASFEICVEIAGESHTKAAFA